MPTKVKWWLASVIRYNPLLEKNKLSVDTAMRRDIYIFNSRSALKSGAVSGFANQALSPQLRRNFNLWEKVQTMVTEWCKIKLIAQTWIDDYLMRNRAFIAYTHCVIFAWYHWFEPATVKFEFRFLWYSLVIRSQVTEMSNRLIKHPQVGHNNNAALTWP